MAARKARRPAADKAARRPSAVSHAGEQRGREAKPHKLELQDLRFHPLAELFPLIEGADFDELVADVRAHGVRKPIWLYEEKILDGRNRHRAAAEVGVPCPMRPYEGDDPVGFVISLNLKRRHLSESQRAMVAAKLATLRSGDNQYSEGLPIGRSSELLNVSERTIARAREVRE